MIIHDLSPNTVEQMVPVDLSSLEEEPASPIDAFTFHDCTCGIGCFAGQPPWERHTAGDELLHVLAGESHLTVFDETGAPVSRTIKAGDLVIVPQGRWHNNDAPDGVTMLYMTPSEGNEHSWDTPRLA